MQNILKIKTEIEELMQNHFESNGHIEFDTGAHCYENESAMMFAEGVESALAIVNGCVEPIKQKMKDQIHNGESNAEKDYEITELNTKVEKLLDAVAAIEEKVREIYRNNGEDEEIAKPCNEIFDIVRLA